MKYIEFQYRDGGNYKWNCIIAISDAKFKQLESDYGTIGVGTELLYDTNLGITQDEFHQERGYQHDNEIDHNILEVIDIMDKLPENEFETWTIN